MSSPVHAHQLLYLICLLFVLVVGWALNLLLQIHSQILYVLHLGYFWCYQVRNFSWLYLQLKLLRDLSCNRCVYPIFLFTIYGRGSHLGHVANIILTHFISLYLKEYKQNLVKSPGVSEKKRKKKKEVLILICK